MTFPKEFWSITKAGNQIIRFTDWLASRYPKFNKYHTKYLLVRHALQGKPIIHKVNIYGCTIHVNKVDGALISSVNSYSQNEFSVETEGINIAPKVQHIYTHCSPTSTKPTVFDIRIPEDQQTLFGVRTENPKDN